jgi:hypothetical protein
MLLLARELKVVSLCFLLPVCTGLVYVVRDVLDGAGGLKGTEKHKKNGWTAPGYPVLLGRDPLPSTIKLGHGEGVVLISTRLDAGQPGAGTSVLVPTMASEDRLLDDRDAAPTGLPDIGFFEFKTKRTTSTSAGLLSGRKRARGGHGLGLVVDELDEQHPPACFPTPWSEDHHKSGSVPGLEEVLLKVGTFQGTHTYHITPAA